MVFFILVDIESLLIGVVPLCVAHRSAASHEPRVSFKHFV